MVRHLALAFALCSSLTSALAGTGCRSEPGPTTPSPGDVPPLPPASGTPVGYLLDNATALELTEAQIAELRRIDASLSVRNEAIDTQLREIEKPEPPPPEDPKAPPPPPPNMAPGQQPMRTTPDAGKLHAARAANNREGLEKAFALLAPRQQEAARKLLAERGITAPGAGDGARPPGPGDDDAAGEGGGAPVPYEP